MSLSFSSLRIVVVTWLVCVVGYGALVLAAGQTLSPWSAQGSLIERGGRTVGSALIGQPFHSQGYFWPRPSAVDYDGAAAGGSNKSPTSPDLTERALDQGRRYGMSAQNPLPADLAAASGSGLDPHISLDAALYQVARVARARQVSEADLRGLVERSAFSPGGPLARARIVNVLELNLALDRLR